MTTGIFGKYRIGALLAALVTAGTVGAVGLAASSATAADADEGRNLVGSFCGGLCISLAFDEAATTSANRTDFNLRPGTYWLTVNDDQDRHNFALKSPDGTVEEFTGVPDKPGMVTVKLLLKHGTYRFFCNAPRHEDLGMWVDFEVGGEGQVD